LGRILSYKEFVSDLHLSESLDSFIDFSTKYNIGQSVKVKDRLCKITAFDGKNYLVLLDGKNVKVSKDQIEELNPKKKSAVPTRKKKPIEKKLNI
jgi:hypothetical protein